MDTTKKYSILIHFIFINSLFIVTILLLLFFPDIFFLKNLLLFFLFPILYMVFVYNILYKILWKIFKISFFEILDIGLLYATGFFVTTFFLFLLIFIVNSGDLYLRYIFSDKININSTSNIKSYKNNTFVKIEDLDILYESGAIYTTINYFKNTKSYSYYYAYPTKFNNISNISNIIVYDDGLGKTFKEGKKELIEDNGSAKYGFIISDSNDKINSLKAFENLKINKKFDPLFIKLTPNQNKIEKDGKLNFTFWLILLNLFYGILPWFILNKIN